jgi:signal transduction histidine kinase
MTLAGLSLIVIGAAAVGTWLMAGRVLLPIRQLARQTSNASAQHMTVRLETPSKDAEMTDLVDTLNGLLDRVYQEAELKGRFYAAASHELRTPLQALSGHLELSLSRKRSAEEYEEVVKESYIQARRLISLTQSLLFLHQVDSRTDANQETVNLTDACESALEMTHSQMMKRNLKLEESIQSNIQVLAVPSHAEVLARNLIENASKYATEGGVIGIALKTVDGEVVLEVENDFPDSIKIATQNIFQPFYRDDTSRNSKTGGNGLGLAICRAITVANGWEVEITQDGGKIRAIVNFGSAEQKKDPKGKKKAAPSISRPATA